MAGFECLESYQTGYEKGINDIWELVKLICLPLSFGGFETTKLYDIYGSNDWHNILTNYSAAQVLDIFNSYKKKNTPSFENVINLIEQAKIYNNENGYHNMPVYLNKAINMLKTIQKEYEDEENR